MCPYEVHPFIYMKDKLVFEQYKRDAELLRLQTYYIVVPHIEARKNHIYKPSDLIPYSWDKQKQITINPEDYTEDVFAALDEKFCR